MNAPLVGIATDGAHSMKKGLTRYQGVDLATGEVIFHEAIGNQTVNIGEFLGVITAAKYIIENNYEPKIIYSDSITAITWFKNKQTASKKKYPELQKAEVFLKVMAAEIDQIEIVHWDNSKWGETPADFGEK